MYNLNMLIIFISFMVGQVHKRSVTDIQDNFSHKTQVYIQKAINRIFILLKINKQFNKSNKTISMVNLLEYNKRIAVYNWELYNNLTFIIKQNESTIPLLFQLHEVVKEISKEFTLVFFNCTSEFGLPVYRKIDSNLTDENCTPFFDQSSYFNETMRIETQFKKFYASIDDFLPKSYHDFERNISSNIHLDYRSLGYLNNSPHRRTLLFDASVNMIQRYPFMVSVHSYQTFLCSGSIIYKNLIITAASCIYLFFSNRKIYEAINVSPPRLSVRFGTNYVFKGGRIMPIETLHICPEYVARTNEHNIAILKTIARFDFTMLTVGAIPMDFNYFNKINASGNIDVIGWSENWNSKALDSKMKTMTKISLKILDNEKCKRIYSDKLISEHNICAGLDVSENLCKIQVDSGGPGIYQGKLYGVLSSKTPICGGPDGPAVFTRLDWHMSWITYMIDFLNKAPDLDSELKDNTSSLVRIGFNDKNPLYTYQFKPYKTKGDKYKAKPSNVYIELKNILRDVFEDLAKQHNMTIEDLLNDNVSDFNVTFLDNSEIGSYEPYTDVNEKETK